MSMLFNRLVYVLHSLLLLLSFWAAAAAAAAAI
jgi:hypothetical protein